MPERLKMWANLISSDYAEDAPDAAPHAGTEDFCNAVDVVTSLCDDGRHMPCLDIDLDCRVSGGDLPSGVVDLFFDPTGSVRYGVRRLRRVFADAGIPLGPLRIGAISFACPVRLVPSETKGHFHLYIDHPLTWKRYEKLLLALSGSLLEGGYVNASIERGMTRLALHPWKEQAEKIRKSQESKKA
jgi:hypothetical protein